jgi:meso-butanediol dehydrogenase / (S,S)-butanediol dehydrogenase / diacetyl reductase
MRDLRDRTFVVTGAASGIGRATALRLVDEGAKVALVDRDIDAATTTAESSGDPSRTFVTAADVAEEADVTAAVLAAEERFGALHGAVTSAGIFDPLDLTDIGDADLATFDRVLGVNLRGTFLTLRAVLPRLDPGGAIVTVASTAGLRGHGFGAAYTSSKGGVIALTRLAALQYGPRGVRVNCVCPGATAGEGMGSTFLDPEFAESMSRDVPLRRVGAASELGATIATLLSDDASYLSGQIIAVDGGATVR